MTRSKAKHWRGMAHATSRLLVLVLLGAAVGKFSFLPVESRLGIFAYPRVVFLEVAAAAWFFWLAAVYPKVTRAGGSALFGSFAVYSLWSWLRGEPYQCFGQTGISSRVALTIDMAEIGVLLFVTGPRSVLVPMLPRHGVVAREQSWTGTSPAENESSGGIGWPSSKEPVPARRSMPEQRRRVHLIFDIAIMSDLGRLAGRDSFT